MAKRVVGYTLYRVKCQMWGKNDRVEKLVEKKSGK